MCGRYLIEKRKMSAFLGRLNRAMCQAGQFHKIATCPHKENPKLIWIIVKQQV